MTQISNIILQHQKIQSIPSASRKKALSFILQLTPILLILLFLAAVTLTLSDRIGVNTGKDETIENGNVVVKQYQQIGETEQIPKATTGEVTVVKKTSITAELIEGSVTLKNGNSIGYYHRSAAPVSKHSRIDEAERYELVLLHGAAFTREDWVKEPQKLLSLFQDKFPQISVTAFDLPVSADHHQLVDLLESATRTKIGNSNRNPISSLPVTGLVTPSASGKTITDWIIHQNDDNNSLPIAKLGQYVSHWIPVASGSVKKCSGEHLKRVGMLRSDHQSFEIFAIYGNRDRTGSIVTERLVEYSNSKSLELEGGHPVYLDSPLEFVQAVGEEIVA